MIRSALENSSSREKEKKEDNSHKASMGTLCCGHSLPIYRYLVCDFLIKTLIIISISTNMHRLDVCVPIGSYISLVSKSIDSITYYWLIN